MIPAEGNLPAEPNSFVGRDRDLAELVAMLDQVRAVTLCGPGGIGKTRLALRLAATLRPGYPDGAWLIDLADVDPGHAPERLMSLLTSTLGIRSESGRTLAETTAHALAHRKLLIVLDTCERLTRACADLADGLLAACPGLRLIATSREPLRVHDEVVWRVPPLGVPPEPVAAVDPANSADVAGVAPGYSSDDLPQCESVQLFVARARAARPGFGLTAANAAAVSTVCRRLDGVPLAIELAAARARTLSVEQISDRLARTFEFLALGDRTAPPRQQTLRAAVAWSYDLLARPEQLLLSRLSVFHGWTLYMAEQVCADQIIPAADILGLLAALIDKSLVVVETEMHGRVRYRLLDAVRELAAEHAPAGEQPRLRVAHRDCMLDIAEQIAARAFVRGEPSWPERIAMYQRVMADRPNFQSALAGCVERGDSEAGLQLCHSLSGSWLASGDFSEGADWLNQLLALDDPAPPGVRARALAVRAELAFEQQDYAGAQRYATECLALSETCQDGNRAGALRLLALLALAAGAAQAAEASAEAAVAAARQDGDDWEAGIGLAALGAVAAAMGDLARAQQLLEQAEGSLQDNNGWGLANVRYGLGRVARARDDPAAAIRYFESAHAIYSQIEARPEMARCMAGIGLVALAQGDEARARASLADSLRLSLITGQRLPIARGIAALASVSALEGDYERAVQLGSAARELFASIGRPKDSADRRLARLFAQAEHQLGPERTARWIAAGRTMSPYDAAQLAMTGSGSDDPAAQNGGPEAGHLTDREYEVALLVAQGLSNREIGQRLFISTATVARHVANIFAKLGVNSRAQLAAWVADGASKAQTDEAARPM
jgi:predicted ATPase/DNA-binding CsgD family transcriptional regulator